MEQSHSKQALLEKIYLLELALGRKYSHGTLEPFKFDSTDVIEVQKAGKRIGEFIGINGLVFIVAYTKQRSKIGGHIELNQSKEVFIEIEKDFKDDCEIVLAILAHEICHKYLYLNNIELHPESENEILTDVATVYTGLGKLSLNGCETSKVFQHGSGEQATTITTNNKVGYLNRGEFAFVYKIICTMRGVSKTQAIHLLSRDVKDTLFMRDNNESFYFDQQYFTEDTSITDLRNDFDKEVKESQIEFATFLKNIRIVEENIVGIANTFRSNFHGFIKKQFEKIVSMHNVQNEKREFRYIKNLMIRQNLIALKALLLEKETEIQQLNNDLNSLIASTSKHYSYLSKIDNTDFLFLFSCPTCSSKMRIKDKKLAHVKCSKCDYSFIVDTGLNRVQSAVGRNEKGSKKSGVVSKLRGLFFRGGK